MRRFKPAGSCLHFDIRNLCSRTAKTLKKHAGKIAYYASIAVLLCVFAVAAEQYRNNRESHLQSNSQAALPATARETEASEAKPGIIFQPDAVLLRDYSAQPIWVPEMQCWQAHTGMDIAIESKEVKCICSGTVISTGKSAIYGGFMDVQAGEMLFRYASIAPDRNIQAGQAVETGDILGTTESSMPAEAYMQPHLHMEIYSNDAEIDYNSIKNLLPAAK